MSLLERTYKKNIASGSLWQQILGALAKHWWLTLLFVLFCCPDNHLILSAMPWPCLRWLPMVQVDQSGTW
jgi:hypothetical protein